MTTAKQIVDKAIGLSAASGVQTRINLPTIDLRQLTRRIDALLSERCDSATFGNGETVFAGDSDGRPWSVIL